MSVVSEFAALKGAALAQKLQEALSKPAIHDLSAIHGLSCVQVLGRTKTFSLIQLFASGTYEEYSKNRQKYPKLNTGQETKLKQLSVISLASQRHTLIYDDLLRALEITAVPQLEDLIRGAVYWGFLSGELDSKKRCFVVKSAVGRTLASRTPSPTTIAGLLGPLDSKIKRRSRSHTLLPSSATRETALFPPTPSMPPPPTPAPWTRGRSPSALHSAPAPSRPAARSHSTPPPSHAVPTDPIFFQINRPDLVPPERLAHTCALLRQLIGALARNNEIGQIYQNIFAQIIQQLRHKYKLKNKDVNKLLKKSIEQAWSATVIWGQTPTKQDRLAELGFLHPVLNLSLCEAYEHTFVADDAANLLLRGQLGSFIILTFMHESSHSFAHRLTLRFLPLDWSTPDVQGDGRGESGALLEERLLRGKLTAMWDGEDVTKPNRFQLIREVWLQPTSATSPNGPLWEIPGKNLKKFHDAVLAGKTTIQLFDDCFGKTKNENVKTFEELTQGDRRLLRMTPISARARFPGIAPEIDFALEHPPWCVNGLERAAARNPAVAERWMTPGYYLDGDTAKAGRGLGSTNEENIYQLLGCGTN